MDGELRKLIHIRTDVRDQQLSAKLVAVG